jgi:hypothetical protein
MMTEQKLDYIWFPNTKDHGKEFDAGEIIENSAQYLHRGWEYCGVYFLIDCQEIVYVGKSINVKNRLRQHSESGQYGMEYEKNFNRFFFINCQLEELDELEAYYILKFRPKYNISIPRGEK